MLPMALEAAEKRSVGMRIEDPTLEGLYKHCPIRGVLHHLSDRWTVLVMVELVKGTQRFTQLRRAIPDISPRMLSRTVRQLEEDGLISRTVYPTIPPRVEYALTEVGVTFMGALQPLVNWAAENFEKVMAARAAYVPPAAQEPL
jgi:DNA-binding HxlR family transcriptional regulator